MRSINPYKRSWFIPPSDVKAKLQLRQHFCAVRSHIAMSYREQVALRAAQHVVDSAVFQRSQRMGCYLHAKYELDTSFLIQAIWEANKTCYLPVLATDESGLLKFVRYRKGDTLHPNRYAILEPVDTATEIAPTELDTVIVPLVAFDLAGHRLGTGGGYYDKTFAFLSQDTHLTKRPYLIGFAYAAQQAAMLPVDPWDIALDGIATEKGFVAGFTKTT